MCKNENFSELKDLTAKVLCDLGLLDLKMMPVSGIPSGFMDLDSYTEGFQKSDFIVIASRPSLGKTSLVLNIARYVANKERIPVLFFSLEMSSVQIATQLLSIETEIKDCRLKSRKLNKLELRRIAMAIEVLKNTPIIIEDTSCCSIEEIINKSKKAYNDYGIGIIIIDYLQLVTCLHSESKRSESLQYELSQISKALSKLAKELDIPIICLSQLPRDVENREGKTPKLTDLGEVGEIADTVLLLPPCYGFTAEVIIAKQKNGNLGSVNLEVINKVFPIFDFECKHDEKG